MYLEIIKKELKENFYVSKGVWWLAISSVLLTAVCLLFTSIRELSFIGQTEVIQYATKISIFLSVLVTMVLGSASFSSEREESTIESLLLSPIPKMQLSNGKLTGVLIIGALIYLISLPYIVVLGVGTGLILRSVLFMIIVGVLLLFAYGCISIALSIVIPSSKASILLSIMTLLITAIPAFMSGIIKTTIVGTFINNISPISNCFKLMSALIVEQQKFTVLMGYFIPILVFVALGYVLVFAATQSIAFKGGE